MSQSLRWSITKVCPHFYFVSLKYDLNPIFRRKGALLWPPLHPSPHSHPPCLGRRTKVAKRLSIHSRGSCLVGCSWEPLPPIPPPSLFPPYVAPYLAYCMSQPLSPWAVSSIILIMTATLAAIHVESFGFASPKNFVEALKVEQKSSRVMCHMLLMLLLLFFH